jgi:hypothetical protein
MENVSEIHGDLDAVAPPGADRRIFVFLVAAPGAVPPASDKAWSTERVAVCCKTNPPDLGTVPTT